MTLRADAEAFLSGDEVILAPIAAVEAQWARASNRVRCVSSETLSSTMPGDRLALIRETLGRAVLADIVADINRRSSIGYACIDMIHTDL